MHFNSLPIRRDDSLRVLLALIDICFVAMHLLRALNSKFQFDRNHWESPLNEENVTHLNLSVAY